MTDRLGKELVTERARPNLGFCAFCGAPTTGYACRAHSDLPLKEPHRLLSGGRPNKEETGDHNG